MRGYRPDPHVLTAFLWHAVTSACVSSAPCIIGVNAALFALLLAVGVVLAEKRIGLAAAVLFMAGLGVLPFDVPLLNGPLGGEITVTLALVAIAAAVLAGIWNPPAWLRSVLAAAIVLQDPGLTAAALFLGPFGAVPAVAARIALGNPSAAQLAAARLDDLAGPVTVAVLGIAIVFAAPAALFTVKRGWFSRLGTPTVVLARTVLFAVLSAAGGMIARSGDPSPYFLCAAVALAVFGFAWAIGKALLRVRIATVFAACSLLLLIVLHQRIPSVVIAKQTSYLQNDIAQDVRDGISTCLVASGPSREHLLVPGLRLRDVREVNDIRQCPGQYADTTHLLSADGIHIDDWGVSGLNLAHAAKIAAAAGYVFPINDGSVSPHAHMKTPTGTGVFAQHIPSASGAVPTFTVLGGFSYSFHCLRVATGDRLVFAVTQIPGAPRATYAVSAGTGSRLHTLTQGVLERNARSDYAWRFVSAVFLQGANCTDVRFSVPSPQLRQNRWVTFAGASIASAEVEIARSTKKARTTGAEASQK